MSARGTPQVGNVGVDEHNAVPLKDILRTLTFMAKNIRDKSELIFENIKTQLKKCGYDYWFGDNPDERQMMKALAVAVNEAIQEKIEPVDKKSKQLNNQLYNLLVKDKETKTSPKSYMSSDKKKGGNKLNSPLVLAKIFLRRGAPDWVVKNMIQRQFDIKWDKASGERDTCANEPKDFTFYKFCNMKNTSKHFTYIPRQAHVKATLYKECCRKPKRAPAQLPYDLLAKPRNVLCPDVFVKTVHGWKVWKANEEEPAEGEKKYIFHVVKWAEAVSWIRQPIRNFIKNNADTQKPDGDSLEETLEKPTLYWAVVQESDFKPGKNAVLKLEEFSSTQVYGGKANKGILGRWMKDSDNHCEMMKKCLNNVCAMTTYEPVLLKGIQLVDARLALAKVRGEKTALFVMKTFGDDEEKAEIAVEKAKQRLRGAQGKAKEEAEECLNEAKNRLADVKKNQTNHSEIINDLERAEKLHLKGERAGASDNYIIPHKNDEMLWQPTDMRCGMNKNS